MTRSSPASAATPSGALTPAAYTTKFRGNERAIGQVQAVGRYFRHSCAGMDLDADAADGAALEILSGRAGRMRPAASISTTREVVAYGLDRIDPDRDIRIAGERTAARLADLAACDAVTLPDDDALAAVALGPERLAAVLSPNAVPISCLL